MAKGVVTLLGKVEMKLAAKSKLLDVHENNKYCILFMNLIHNCFVSNTTMFSGITKSLLCLTVIPLL